MTFLIATALSLLAAPALAADNVQLKSEVFVERSVTGPDGKTTTTLEAPKTVVPGDRVLIVLDYRNAGDAPANQFTVINPLPAAVAFSSAVTAGSEVSVDGGRAWGQLADLTVTNPDGTRRPAQGGDVSHVRWVLKSPIGPQAGGKLSFNGVVR